jgi:hypothetical protein
MRGGWNMLRRLPMHRRSCQRCGDHSWDGLRSGPPRTSTTTPLASAGEIAMASMSLSGTGIRWGRVRGRDT